MMKKYFVLLSLFMLLTNSAFAVDLVDDYFDIARNFYKAREYTKSIEYINTVLNINPNHLGASYLLIKLTNPVNCLSESTIDKEITIVPKPSKTGNKIADDLIQKGVDCFSLEKYSDAIIHFNASLKECKKNKYVYNYLGLSCWKLGDFKKAAYYFKKSNSSDRSFTASLDNYAMMCIKNKEYKLAREIVKTSICINKNDYCAYYLLGIIDKKEGNYTQAIDNFNLVSQIRHKFSIVYLQLADVYHLTKNYSWSNASIYKYLQSCPNDDSAYFLLYRNYRALKDYDFSKKHIIKAIQLSNTEDYRIELARLEADFNNVNSAIEILKTIKSPTAQILNELGQYYLRINNNINALKCFEDAYKSPASRPIYLYNSALVYRNMNQSANCQKVISQIAAIKPKSFQDYIDLSGIYLDCEGKNKSLAIINAGIKKYPKIQELYLVKIKIYNITLDKVNEQIAIKQMQKVFGK